MAHPDLRALPPGSTIRIIAPAGPVSRSTPHFERFQQGLSRMAARWAWDIQLDDTVRRAERYLAGSDEQRAEAWLRAWADPSVDAIWCARGGYGCTRLLRRLPAEPPQRASSAPVVVGFSDITALHCAAQRWGAPTWHAPVVTQLADLDADAFDWLDSNVVAGMPDTWTWQPEQGAPFRPGLATACIVGGNLSVLASLAGTAWAPPMAGRLVALEDIGEPAYRVDRAARQLADACGLDRAAGIILGDFQKENALQRTWIADFWSEFATEIDGPVVSGAAFGHIRSHRALPLGLPARLCAADLDGAHTAHLSFPPGGRTP